MHMYVSYNHSLCNTVAACKQIGYWMNRIAIPHVHTSNSHANCTVRQFDRDLKYLRIVRIVEVVTAEVL